MSKTHKLRHEAAPSSISLPCPVAALYPFPHALASPETIGATRLVVSISDWGGFVTILK